MDSGADTESPIKLGDIIDVGEFGGFDEDLLRRSALGDALTATIMRYKRKEGAMVLSISGDWGTGKTTFLKMWMSSLREQDESIQSIYINAQKQDGGQDPFEVLSEAIIQRANLLLNNRLERTWASVQTLRAKDVVWKFAKLTWLNGSLAAAVVAVAIGVRVPEAELFIALVNWCRSHKRIVGSKDSKAEEQESTDLEGELAALISAIEKIAEKQKGAEDAPEAAPEDVPEAAPEAAPLVIVIDELDRCRPGFAVELIERTGRLFSVAGVVFVLAINRRQIEASIRTINSVENARAYLQKFITFEMALPRLKLIAPSAGRQEIDSGFMKLTERLAENYNCKAADQRLGTNRQALFAKCRDFIAGISSRYVFTIRDCEKIFMNLHMIATHGHGTGLDLGDAGVDGLCCLLSILKVKDNQAFSEICEAYAINDHSALEKRFSQIKSELRQREIVCVDGQSELPEAEDDALHELAILNSGEDLAAVLGVLVYQAPEAL